VLPPSGPVALHVCRESRAIALENYERAFRRTTRCLQDYRSVQQWLERGYEQGRIWIDFKRDTIFYNEWLRSQSLFKVSSPEAMKVETMTIYHRGYMPDVIRESVNYWSLKTIRVYYEHLNESEADGLQKVLMDV
jgi:hypothetical protein